MKTIDLSGTWRFNLVDDAQFAGRNFDDSAWVRMHIPQNWFLAGVEHHGPAWFRRTFHYAPSSPQLHQTLQFDGVDYFADVYLNGRLIGKHSGYFEPFSCDVTGIIRSGINVLAVRVDSPYEAPGLDGWHMRKQLIKGVLNHHDCRPGGGWEFTGQSHNTGGIWNRVRLAEHDEVTIDFQFLSARFDGPDPALQVDLVIMNRGAETSARIGLLLEPDNFTEEGRFQSAFDLALAPGLSTHSLTLPVPDVRRWNPWERGYPHLYRLRLRLARPDRPAIERSTPFGFRTVSVDENFNWLVNGEPFYPRGSNYIASQWLSETLFTQVAASTAHPFQRSSAGFDEETGWFERDVSLMVAANLNFIRVHAHVLPPEFHQACDRAGILVWQDFPFQWGYSDTAAFHEEAERQAKAMVRLLYNHPSIVAWCVHNESPWDADWMAGEAGGTHDPGHNRDLDHHLADVVRRIDTTRYTHTNSGTGDGHTYPGWYHGTWHDYAQLPAAPFPTEYGAQAAPVKDNVLRTFPDLGPDAGYAEMAGFLTWLSEHIELIDNRQLPQLHVVPEAHHLGYLVTQRWRFHDFQPLETFTPGRVPLVPMLERFIEESQAYQCWIIQYGTENYRRRRDKTTGIFQFMLTDPWPAVTWSVLDYWRTAKPGYEVLTRVMQPVLPVVSGILPTLPKGPANSMELTVTNDHLKPIPNARCEWMFASGIGDEQRGSLALDIPAFGVSEPVALEINEIQEGENYLALFLYDENHELIARNHYFFTGTA